MMLDPLFMFRILPAGKEVMGAAVATMISNTAVLVYFLVLTIRLRDKTVLSLRPDNGFPDRSSVRSVFAIGLTSALSTWVANFSAAVTNRMIAGYGEVSLAAMGIVKKIDMLPMNIGMGLCQGMMPLVAYNYASGNYERMRAVTITARKAGMAFSGLCVAAFEVFSGRAVRIFIGDPATVAAGASFLRAACLAVPFMVCNFQLIYCLQSMNRGRESLLLSVSRQGIVYLPVLFVMKKAAGLTGIIWTPLIAECLTAAVSGLLYERVYRQLSMGDKPAVLSH